MNTVSAVVYSNNNFMSST